MIDIEPTVDAIRKIMHEWKRFDSMLDIVRAAYSAGLLTVTQANAKRRSLERRQAIAWKRLRPTLRKLLVSSVAK